MTFLNGEMRYSANMINQLPADYDETGCLICLEDLAVIQEERDNPQIGQRRLLETECCHKIFCDACLVQTYQIVNHNCPHCRRLLDGRFIQRLEVGAAHAEEAGEQIPLIVRVHELVDTLHNRALEALEAPDRIRRHFEESRLGDFLIDSSKVVGFCASKLLKYTAISFFTLVPAVILQLSGYWEPILCANALSLTLATLLFTSGHIINGVSEAYQTAYDAWHEAPAAYLHATNWIRNVLRG